ncbi:hypothetical protein D9758_013174 [Tetrapyrgos nigripes]|uniref:Uncharacterized protein n=1 Tax=Tetrapyrgos nigripes TaxID=182062 RepID=A0A8H5FKM6_9AGAR|nr:hypothetical protein D9758_013174 [Tetrapyrgos nigripes]
MQYRGKGQLRLRMMKTKTWLVSRWVGSNCATEIEQHSNLEMLSGIGVMQTEILELYKVNSLTINLRLDEDTFDLLLGHASVVKIGVQTSPFPDAVDGSRTFKAAAKRK